MSNTTSRIKALTKRSVRKGLVGTAGVLRKSKLMRRAGKMVKNVVFPMGAAPALYEVNKYYPSIAEYVRERDTAGDFGYKPLISIVMPTYNTDAAYLRECIDSVLLQSYSNWELCVADDHSTDEHVVEILREYAKKDNRIKYMVRKQNGHISLATNSAIELAGGEFIALLDHDDVLWPNALYEIVTYLNDNPKLDLIYTDEDKINADGFIHSYPFFKPDWSPEFLESCNYITHFSCIRATLIQEVGGLRKGYEGAQDWDLLLRVTEKSDAIAHIPKVLYSWRIHEASTAMSTDAKPYVYEAQRKLMHDHIERSGLEAVVKQGIIKQHCSVEYAVIGNPLVSVVVYGGSFDYFKRSVASVLHHASYKQREILLAPADAKSRAYAGRLARRHANLRVLDVHSTHTRAAAYTLAAEQAKGEYVVFVDGTMTIQTPRWIELLLGDAQRAGVGAVGGKTLNATRDRILRAGAAVGVYSLYAHLLEGMPVEDIHYMRGLYGQSRRNTAAVDSGCLMMRASDVRSLGGFNTKLEDMTVIDLCLRLRESGKRIVYNPFIETSDLENITAGEVSKGRKPAAAKAFVEKWAAYIDDDPYFDPGFTRCNAQLEIN